VARVKKFRSSRNQSEVSARLEKLLAVAKTDDNLLYPMKEALRVGATLGEVSDVLRQEFGVYQPS
ncbi:MAG: methylmalonyl-CoA mutase family protein, partial [Actinomycetota bacterium]